MISAFDFILEIIFEDKPCSFKNEEKLSPKLGFKSINENLLLSA